MGRRWRKRGSSKRSRKSPNQKKFCNFDRQFIDITAQFGEVCRFLALFAVAVTKSPRTWTIMKFIRLMRPDSLKCMVLALGLGGSSFTS